MDYIDYYLLHSVGNGGIKTFRARYIDNGMIDFLMEERKAGRIRNLGFSFHGTVDVFDEILAMHDRIHWDFVQIQLNYADWKHASGNNVNAEYLYGELVKRGIPAIIMEPLLGGRLSKLNDHLVARLKQHRRIPIPTGGTGVEQFLDVFRHGRQVFAPGQSAPRSFPRKAGQQRNAPFLLHYETLFVLRSWLAAMLPSDPPSSFWRI